MPVGSYQVQAQSEGRASSGVFAPPVKEIREMMTQTEHERSFSPPRTPVSHKVDIGVQYSSPEQASDQNEHQYMREEEVPVAEALHASETEQVLVERKTEQAQPLHFEKEDEPMSEAREEQVYEPPP